MRAIAADLGRAASTISRELARHRSAGEGYLAKRAHAIAFEEARRPQEAKIDANPVLRGRVLGELGRKYSPEEIAGRLRLQFPDDPEMNVHH